MTDEEQLRALLQETCAHFARLFPGINASIQMTRKGRRFLHYKDHLILVWECKELRPVWDTSIETQMLVAQAIPDLFQAVEREGQRQIKELRKAVEKLEEFLGALHGQMEETKGA